MFVETLAGQGRGDNGRVCVVYERMWVVIQRLEPGSGRGIVYGFGEDKTPASFRNACDTFTYLEVLREGEVEALAAPPARVASKELRSNTKLVSGRRCSVANAAGEDDMCPFGSLPRPLARPYETNGRVQS